MPRVSTIEIYERGEQFTLYIRTKSAVQDLPDLIGKSYGALAAYLKELGAFLADVPYVAYHNMDMENLDVEMGFPVVKALPEKGEIKAGKIPAGKAVFSMFLGPYQEMESLYNEMAKWIVDNGYESDSSVYEYYYNDPDEFSESEALTKVVMPVR